MDELEVIAKEIRTRISMLSTKLVKHLKRRDKYAYKLQRNFDVLTAILQAVSLKRREYKVYCMSSAFDPLLINVSAPDRVVYLCGRDAQKREGIFQVT